MTWASRACRIEFSRSSKDEHLVDRAGQVVVDVAEVAAQLRRHVRDLAAGDVDQRPLQRQHRPLELDQFALELVDALDRALPVAGEDHVLERVDVVLDLARRISR